MPSLRTRVVLGICNVMPVDRPMSTEGAIETRQRDYRNPAGVAIIGLGPVGVAVGAVLASRGLKITGIETSDAVRQRIASGESPYFEAGLDDLLAASAEAGTLRVTGDVALVAEADVILVTVGTPLSADREADLSQLKNALEGMAPYLTDGQLVILKSTVPPGTTREIAAPLLRAHADVLVAFCPERLAEGQAVRDVESLPVIVGGVDEVSAQAAHDFFSAALPVDVVTVRGSTEAEMTKLADNLWIDVNIALANELALLCAKLDVDVLDVISAANTLQKGQHHVNILTPSVGVGGSCLTKDPWFVQAFGASRNVSMAMPATGRQINERMPGESAALLKEALGPGEDGMPRKVAVLGLAFKSDSGDCRETPALPFIQALLEDGFDVVANDPLVEPVYAADTFPVPIVTDVWQAIDGADCIAFLAGHHPYRQMDPEKIAQVAKTGALIFDGRMYFGRDRIAEFAALGLGYKGIGR